MMTKKEALTLARKAIRAYEAKNKVADAIMWTEIINAIEANQK